MKLIDCISTVLTVSSICLSLLFASKLDLLEISMHSTDSRTFIYDYQTLITGITALLVGGATVFYLHKQIQQEADRRRLQTLNKKFKYSHKILIFLSHLDHFDEQMKYWLQYQTFTPKELDIWDRTKQFLLTPMPSYISEMEEAEFLSIKDLQAVLTINSNLELIKKEIGDILNDVTHPSLVNLNWYSSFRNANELCKKRIQNEIDVFDIEITRHISQA